MAVLPYGPWGPDRWNHDSEFAGEALGVLPKAGSYGPWPGLAATSLAVGDPVRGAYAARKDNGTFVVFCGTADALYKFAGTTTAWTDVSKSGGYNLPTDGFWSFCQFDNILIATNGVDDPQYIDVDSGTEFADLTGAPKAKFCKTVGDYVFLAQLGAAQGPAADVGEIQIIWSGQRDPAHWTIGEKSCDFATFWDGGFVQGVTSLIGGLVILRSGIQRFGVGQYRAFDFAPVLDAQGTDSPNSIVQDEAAAYFYSPSGFVGIGSGVEKIGFEFVDRWFAEQANPSRVNEIQGALDPIRKRIFWGFHSISSSSDAFDHIIAYDIRLKRWTHAEVPVSTLLPAFSPGMTLSDIATLYTTLDTVPYPFGSRVWQGGAPGLAAFGTDEKLSFFAGQNLGATMQTSLFQPVPGSRAFVNGWRAIDDAADGEGRVYVSERPQSAAIVLPPETVNDEGVIPARASGRYMRFERTIPAGSQWDDAQGIDFDGDMVVEDGDR